MRVLVVVAHPRADSLTHTLAGEFVRGLTAAGHEHELLDLYRAGFDPVLSAGELARARGEAPPEEIRGYQERLRRAQGLALAYPVWWATPPAILQGWLQRVLTVGFAFETGRGGPRGLLGHRVQLILTSGNSEAGWHAQYVEPLTAVLNFCGMGDVRTLVTGGVYPGMEAARVQAARDLALAAGRDF